MVDQDLDHEAGAPRRAPAPEGHELETQTRGTAREDLEPGVAGLDARMGDGSRAELVPPTPVMPGQSALRPTAPPIDGVGPAAQRLNNNASDQNDSEQAVGLISYWMCRRQRSQDMSIAKDRQMQEPLEP